MPEHIIIPLEIPILPQRSPILLIPADIEPKQGRRVGNNNKSRTEPEDSTCLVGDVHGCAFDVVATVLDGAVYCGFYEVLVSGGYVLAEDGAAASAGLRAPVACVSAVDLERHAVLADLYNRYVFAPLHIDSRHGQVLDPLPERKNTPPEIGKRNLQSKRDILGNTVELELVVGFLGIANCF